MSEQMPREPSWGSSPPPTTSWELGALHRGPFAAERALAASRRLHDLLCECPQDLVVSITYATTPDDVMAVRVDAVTHDAGEGAPDLAWALSDLGTWSSYYDDSEDDELPSKRWEVVPDILRTGRATRDEPWGGQARAFPWPLGVQSDLTEVLQALHQTRGQLRIHVSPASPIEVTMVRDALVHTGVDLETEAGHGYLGRPLRVRMFLGVQNPAGVARVRASVLRLARGVRLQSLDSADPVVERAWRGALSSLQGVPRPEGLALAMLRLPAAPEESRVFGVRTAQRPTATVPISDHLVGRSGLHLGRAVTTAGKEVDVTLDPQDLLRHLQIIGASGSGKTSALAGLVTAAANAGLGCTVLSPHADLIERVAGEVSATAADRVLVVRSGDDANPVPLNALGAGSARTLETVLDVLESLIDPRQEGMFGLRARRLISLGFEAGRVLFGDRSTLLVSSMIYHDQRFVLDLARSLTSVAPDLASALRNEVGSASEASFAELTGWLRSRLQGLLGTPAVAGILGTGYDAVDVTRVLDERGVLLIDLASTQLGASSARMLGELWLAKHWDAVNDRKVVEPHLLVVDEAHLFGAGLLPRLLTEGRKFGLGVVLAHQHLGQLSFSVREAAQANASSLVAFRCGPSEVAPAIQRLGAWPGGALTRLPNLQAACALSLSSAQAEPFTLRIDHNETSTPCAATSQRISEQSGAQLVEPYRAAEVLEPRHLVARVRELAAERRPRQRPAASDGSFLEDWLLERAKGTAQPSEGTEPGSLTGMSRSGTGDVTADPADGCGAGGS